MNKCDGFFPAGAKCLGICLLVTGLLFAQLPTVDEWIEREMKDSGIAGVSISVIDNGEIVRVAGYGVASKNPMLPVTPGTLFQAASISKPVATLGALRLVEEGKLSLDTDVNAVLEQWKVPENEFTASGKVTLRAILSHSAGLTVHGFSGRTNERSPSIWEWDSG